MDLDIQRRAKRILNISSDYILHLKVNSSLFIPDNDGAICSSLSVFGCEVIEKIKGQVLPDIHSHLFLTGNNSTFMNHNISTTANIVDNTNAHFNKIISYNTTNFIFSYCNGWTVCPFDSGRRLFDYPDGEPWIKSGREYIAFLRFLAIGSDGPDGDRKGFYSMIPCPLGDSFGMFPIENGFVLDKCNYLGFGTKVPVDEFKENIRKKIEEIKNFNKI